MPPPAPPRSAGIEEIGGFELCEKFLNHAKHYNLDIREREVSGVESGSDFHDVVLADGSRLYTRTVILAMGGEARKLNVPGEAECWLTTSITTWVLWWRTVWWSSWRRRARGQRTF